MSRAQRDRGARGELEVVGLLQDAGWPARRGFASGGGTGPGGDIEGGPAGYTFEVKRTNRLQFYAALAQAEAAAASGEHAIVAFRRDHDTWCAGLRLGTLLDLLQIEKLYNGTGGNQ
jgi:Holliday junction resolvase